MRGKKKIIIPFWVHNRCFLKTRKAKDTCLRDRVVAEKANEFNIHMRIYITTDAHTHAPVPDSFEVL